MGRTELIAAVAFLILVEAAGADPFSRLWVFGDSTVDTGWFQKAPFSGEANFDVYLAPTSPRGKTGAEKWGIGRATSSPGPMSVEVLGHILGVTAHPRNRLDDRGELGTNYATSGARNQEVNTVAPGLFPNAIPTRRQVDDYLKDHDPRDRALYVVSSGGNDVSSALSSNGGSCTAVAKTDVQTAADSLAHTIRALQDHDVRYVIVANLPESFGTTDEMACRAAYNTMLMTQLNMLAVSYAWGDVNGVRTKIQGSASLFGISILYNTNPACSVPAPSTNIPSSWALLCSPNSPVSTPSNASVSEFADNEHWATGAMKVLGSYYFCLAKYTWPAVFDARPAPHQPPIACHMFNATWT
jgi:phospholipase/lecithinase/hemolysin